MNVYERPEEATLSLRRVTTPRQTPTLIVRMRLQTPVDSHHHGDVDHDDLIGNRSVTKSPPISVYMTSCCHNYKEKNKGLNRLMGGRDEVVGDGVGSMNMFNDGHKEPSPLLVRPKPRQRGTTSKPSFIQ